MKEIEYTEFERFLIKLVLFGALIIVVIILAHACVPEQYPYNANVTGLRP